MATTPPLTLEQIRDKAEASIVEAEAVASVPGALADFRAGVDTATIEAALDHVRAAPRTGGTLDLLVLRPHTETRATPPTGRLTAAEGIVGDNWNQRPSSRTPDQSPHPGRQLTVMNRRFLDVISAGARDRWAWAGDQLIVDLDLSEAALRPGDRLAIGDAIIEVTAEQHTGCKKFVQRYGVDAQRVVASTVGRELRLRGAYVRVVQDGDVAVGDTITRV